MIFGVSSAAAAFTAGARAEVFSDDSPAWLPQAGAEVRLGERDTAYASYTETVRQPSYTELNYESPGSLGNLCAATARFVGHRYCRQPIPGNGVSPDQGRRIGSNLQGGNR